MKRLSLIFACFFAAAAVHAADAALVEASPTAKAKLLDSIPRTRPKWKATPYEKLHIYYSVGESLLKESKEQARVFAVKDASAKAAEFLEKQGFGDRRELAQYVEEGALTEKTVSSAKLGKVKVESVYQEHWQAPDGKDAYSVRLLVSIRRASSKEAK